ncbi:hypothetical protein POZ03_16840 [Bacteroides uniformis]|uniref:hypothetical protein n=1 Tax=Bacteroides uniformis TaxID=820 RepID=UPI00233E8CC2|nr:hypothetical protein [Bacteroides uniformis]MDC1812128.1 hypothetical protein [Bacteroides uniformis]
MKRILLWLIAIIAVSACTAEKDMEQDGSMSLKSRSITSLKVDAQFLKLIDDTTSFVAGELCIDAPGNEKVAIKWNVLPECNLDTTVVSLPMENGKACLPIKWRSCSRDFQHASDSLAFEAGVIISTEDEVKYVRLLWADRIDSLYLARNPVIMETLQSPYPVPRSLTITPPVLQLQDNIGGSMFVSATEKNIWVDISEITPDLNINIDTIFKNSPTPGVISKDNYLVFQWNESGPPLFSFIRPINFNDGSLISTAYIVYKYREDPPAFYRFISALPDIPGNISAVNGFVTVTIETNKEWSISSIYSDNVVEDTDASGLKTRVMRIPINDNPNPEQRLVQVIIKLRGTVKDTINIYQLGTEPVINLAYFRDNMPTPLPKVGGEYTFTFTGDNPGTIQVRAMSGGEELFVGTPVTGLEAKVTVPENPNITDRNVTFQYKVNNGEWASLPVETNRVQLGTDGGETPYLEYVSNTLPTGNIPQPGDLYSFEFRGTYQGRLGIRAVIDGTSYVGDKANAGDWNPAVTVPANPTAAVRSVRFQYRPFDATDAALNKWTNFPNGGITKNQEANTITGTVTPGLLSPAGPIPDDGGTYSCVFTGDYTGDIFMRAMDGNKELDRNSGKIDTSISVDIPKIVDPNRTITFEYSLTGDAPWTYLDAREQKHETVIYGSLEPMGDIPYGGGTYTIKISGTFTKNITVKAREGNSSGPVIVEETSKISPEGHTFRLVIPRNPRNVARAVGFSFIREDQTNETLIVIKAQKEK